MRRGRSTAPGRFEREVARVCALMGYDVRWFVPEPGGRDMNYYRDIEMVGEADVCIAVFDAAEPMEGGTAHVVEKAQDARVPVYAYSWDGLDYKRVGEFDPDDAWARVVPPG